MVGVEKLKSHRDRVTLVSFLFFFLKQQASGGECLG